MSDTESVTSVVEQMEIGGGNTKLHQKRVSQGKKWCFTYNNYPDDALEIMERNFKLHELEYIVGVEVGESGTPHLQGFIEAKKRLRPDQLGLSRKIHWEKAKGSLKQNVAYCSKDGEFRHSKACKPKEPVRILSDDQLRPWQKGILAAIEQRPDDRTIHWYWSNAGETGKTTFCKYLTHKHGAVPISGKGADVRNGICTYMGNNDGDTPGLVVMNVPRCLESVTGGYISYEALENVKDMYFYSGKYEGGVVCGNCPHLYIFANFPPETEKMSADRWVIVNIDDECQEPSSKKQCLSM
jgi:hypothetical protein